MESERGRERERERERREKGVSEKRNGIGGLGYMARQGKAGQGEKTKAKSDDNAS